MKRISLTLLLFCFIVFQSFSQLEMHAFTATGSSYPASSVTDYQCLGINPANLGWKKYADNNFYLSFGEVGASVFSNALTKRELTRELLGFEERSFTRAQKIEAAESFANKGLSWNLDISPISISYQDDNIGGIGIAFRERIYGYFKISQDFSKIMFEGYNAPYFDSFEISTGGDTLKGFSKNPKLYSALLEGTRLSLSWCQELNIGYGRKVLDMDIMKLYAGLGVKIIWGYGTFDIRSENGKTEAYSALSPVFEVEYSKPTPSAIDKSGFVPVGHGLGFDIGFTARILDKINVSAALNDIGSMTWNGDVYEAYDTFLNAFQTSGFGSYNLVKEAQLLFEDDGFFKWKGLKSKKVSLPTNFRIGANYQVFKMLEVGAELYVPLNDVAGNYSAPAFGLGAGFRPISLIRISTGFLTGGNYKFMVPLGVVLSIAHKWELGIATRDVITYFTQDKPCLSLACGFLRFGF